MRDLTCSPCRRLTAVAASGAPAGAFRGGWAWSDAYAYAYAWRFS